MTIKKDYSPVPIVDTEGMEEKVWLNYRRQGIGGSDVSAIFGVSPWTTSRALYYQKIGIDRSTSPNTYTLDFGHHVEPFVAQWFQHEWNTRYRRWLEKHLDVKISSVNLYKDTMMYKHPLYPFMLADLDYRIQVVTIQGEVLDGIFECKTTSYHCGPEKWKQNAVPYEYELQCRHYMSVMNVGFVIIGCLWGNQDSDYRIRFIKRDEEKEKELIDREKDFWENKILKKCPPEISDEQGKTAFSDMTEYNILSLIKEGKMPEINTSDSTLTAAVSDYLTAKSNKDKLSAAVKVEESKMLAARVKILECLAAKMDMSKKKESFVVNMGNGVSVMITNNKIEKPIIDTDNLANDLPDVYAEYLKKSISPRFSVKEV